MSGSEKIYPYRRSQKHCKPITECHILIQCKHILNLLPERAHAFSVFHPTACALADYYEITGRDVGEEGGGGVFYICDGKGRGPFEGLK